MSRFSESEVRELTGARLSGIGCEYFDTVQNRQHEFMVSMAGGYDVNEMRTITDDLIEANRALDGRDPLVLRAEKAAAEPASSYASETDNLDARVMVAREVYRERQWRLNAVRVTPAMCAEYDDEHDRNLREFVEAESGEVLA